ncbi:putative pyruvate, phosphate dikinase regulatory protein [Enterococcus florum]|uniref:Putative pyruvate, phosphate dikinase regulatory protein n=1 Tax=Enterococcus florum TaxID=2480627 RepID=A0A4P5PDA1_9ENTE|nr:pyruvate, water dikinase regulatory protein [Enterococcus florum]GCF93502.1 putative pyruvate, phosphate dikinase regulatory protein [Enterococcus florum]
MKKSVPLYMISDAVGETSLKLVNAVTAQFPTVNFDMTYRFPFTKDEVELKGILSDALKDSAIVVTTLVNENLCKIVSDFSKRTGLQYIDLMNPFMDIIHQKTGVAPLEEAGVVHKLNQEYFNRVAAIEFAVKYDDGKDPKGFLDADIVLLGISRTSKTPLSMYLANSRYKVANLPLIPEVPLPEQIKKVPKEKLVGLIIEPDVQQKIRTSRLHSLGLAENSRYADLERIKEELDYALNVFDELNAFTLDMTNKSIEEAATLIIEQMDSRLAE